MLFLLLLTAPAHAQDATQLHAMQMLLARYRAIVLPTVPGELYPCLGGWECNGRSGTLQPWQGNQAIILALCAHYPMHKECAR